MFSFARSPLPGPEPLCSLLQSSILIGLPEPSVLFGSYSTFPSVLLAAFFLILATAAWASSVFSLPGNWVVLLLALLYGWAEGFRAVTWWVMLAGFLLAGAGEILEFLSSYLGAKAFGGSRATGLFALLGAVAGAVLGAGFGWGLGAIPGTLLGAFAGAFAAECVRGRRAGAALLAASGAALGRAFGLSAKLGFGGAFLTLLYLRVAISLLRPAP